MTYIEMFARASALEVKIQQVQAEIEALETRIDAATVRVNRAKQSLRTLTGQPLPGDPEETSGSSGNSNVLIGLIIIVAVAFVIARFFRKK
jgi:LPXTG-motif cell wall-anchored protein